MLCSAISQYGSDGHGAKSRASVTLTVSQTVSVTDCHRVGQYRAVYTVELPRMETLASPSAGCRLAKREILRSELTPAQSRRNRRAQVAAGLEQKVAERLRVHKDCLVVDAWLAGGRLDTDEHLAKPTPLRVANADESTTPAVSSAGTCASLEWRREEPRGPRPHLCAYLQADALEFARRIGVDVIFAIDVLLAVAVGDDGGQPNAIRHEWRAQLLRLLQLRL
mmetsp:Transcript_23981/g.61210  ORF Transcript_23981/g.61210 Transcript_23981/m.61210 type:complete len:223 (-) Transcript_23981:496-1164(-)